MTTRQQAWELEYRNDRYMNWLSQAELDVRFHEVLNNLANIVQGGKIGITGIRIEPGNPSNLYWLETWTHVLHEYQLRGCGIPPFERGLASLFATPGYDFAQACNAITSIVKPPYLVKFTERTYALEMFERGRILVKRASKYSDTSLNVAQRDNELDPLRLRGGKARATDFMVYCMSYALKPRLFPDFAADAAVVIHNPSEFLVRLDKACAALPFKWRAEIGPVTYVDPLRLPSNAIPAGFAKAFKFAYQAEWRHVWRKLGWRTMPGTFPLELGSLSDISELLTIN